MTYAFPNPWINESAQSQAARRPASPAADIEYPSVSAAIFNSVSDDVPCSSPETEMAPSATLALASSGTAATTVSRDNTTVVADISSDTKIIIESFLDHARRRCMDKISPPLPKVERNIDSVALGAVRRALNIHPRDLDEDPPPLFLRSPRPAFLRALFDLGGVR